MTGVSTGVRPEDRRNPLVGASTEGGPAPVRGPSPAGRSIDTDTSREYRSDMPHRIQRQRTKGWRMPEGAVYVGRPSKWGNKWRVDDELGRGLEWDAETVVSLYRADREWGASEYPDLQREWLAPLRGRDLVCWCPLDKPCHADVLLELANR